MPEFKKSKGFTMKGPTFFKSALKKYGKAPMKDYDVKKGSHDHPHGKPSPAKQGKFGKVLGNVLTGGVSGVIGKIKEKRKAKKAGMEADPAAAAAAPEGMEKAAVAGGAPMMKKGKKIKKRKLKRKLTKAFKAGAAEGAATIAAKGAAKSPAKGLKDMLGKAKGALKGGPGAGAGIGMLLGGPLGAAIGGGIGAIRKKRQAKKAAVESGEAGGAPAPMTKKGNKPKVKYRKRKVKKLSKFAAKTVGTQSAKKEGFTKTVKPANIKTKKIAKKY
jgi:hypothetical protein